MAYVTIVSGPMDGRRFDIAGDEITVGRADTNAIAVDDDAVSGEHCRIFQAGDHFILKDMDSTNGTLLNNSPTTECRLKPGDVITVGAVDMVFDMEDAEKGEPSGVV